MNENVEKVIGTTIAVVGMTTIAWATVRILNKIENKITSRKTK